MKAVGIILAGGNNSRMQELSNKRAIAAMPIGGSYRSIDFASEQYEQFSCTDSGSADTVQCKIPE